MAGPVGFGSGEYGYGPSGMDVQQPYGNSAEDMLVNDIHAIKRKYVDGKTNLRIPISLTAFQTQKQDMQGQTINSIILSVTSGEVWLFLFDNTGNDGNQPVAPDLVVSAGVVPTSCQIMFAEGDNYTITVQEGANSTADGSMRIMKV